MAINIFIPKNLNVVAFKVLSLSRFSEVCGEKVQRVCWINGFPSCLQDESKVRVAEAMANHNDVEHFCNLPQLYSKVFSIRSDFESVVITRSDYCVTGIVQSAVKLDNETGGAVT